MMLKIINLLLFVMISLYSACCLPSGKIQDVASIEQAVQHFVSNNLQHTIASTHRDNVEWKIRVGHIDPRLRLRACDQTLNISFVNRHYSQQTQMVTVQCDHPQTWKIHLPVQIKNFQPVVTTISSFSKGHVLQASDLHMEKRDILALRKSTYQDPTALYGQALKYSVTAGTIISPHLIQPSVVIKRGQQVTILAEGYGVKVSMRGVALKKGYLGDQITVKNKQSKKVIEAIINGPGQVIVQG